MTDCTLVQMGYPWPSGRCNPGNSLQWQLSKSIAGEQSLSSPPNRWILLSGLSHGSIKHINLWENLSLTHVPREIQLGMDVQHLQRASCLPDNFSNLILQPYWGCSFFSEVFTCSDHGVPHKALFPDQSCIGNTCGMWLWTDLCA